jgi:hypothetical protein
VSTVPGEIRPAEAATEDVHPLSGNGILARYGNLTLVCEAVPGQQHRVGALLDAVAGIASSEADGRQLSRELAGLLSAAVPDDDFPALCAFGPVGDGMVAVVHGGAELIITVNGKQMHLDGRDAVTVLDRVITDPVESIQVVVGGTQVGTDTVQVVLPEPSQVPELPAAEKAAVEHAVSEVFGVYCKHDHFSDPEAAYCAVCGISMAQGNRAREKGPRPELGVLVLEDGTTHPLVRDVVLGRAPETDEAVIAGEAEPVTLAHPMVSRRHLRIALREWQVAAIDVGSANGTFLLFRNASTWTRLEPGVETVLTPGSTISLGVPQLRYHSYRSR